MQRYFMYISYRGTNYSGWQKQKTQTTIQGKIEEILHKIGFSLSITGSSRTDKGVHASHQVVHLDIPSRKNTSSLKQSLNSLLHPTIYVHKIIPVCNTNHARFSASSRSYTYCITKKYNPLFNDIFYFYPFDLNLEKMNKATSLITGKLDCKSFCKGNDSLPHHFCKIFNAHWEKKETQLYFYIKANRFVRGMVRTLVNILLDVGREKIEVFDIPKIIEKRERPKYSSLAPAHGLILSRVEYSSISTKYISKNIKYKSNEN